MYTILIVDDEDKIRDVLREYAVVEGYKTLEAKNGRIAVEMVATHDIDLIIMDVMMPEMDGYEAIRRIRKENTIPVLMLSARVEEYDKLFGFELGVDDYVVKPFSPKEVMARVGAIIKRVKKDDTNLYRSDGLVVDVIARSVTVDGEKVILTPREYDLLFYLCKNDNVAISREKLLTAVWGYDFCGNDRTVDTHIKMLRASLGQYRDKIVTLRAMGYKIVL